MNCTYSRIRFFAKAVAISAACFFLSGPARTAPEPGSPVLSAMQEELARWLPTVQKSDPAAYFLSYTVTDRQVAEVSGSNGALLSSEETRNRWLEVQMRVGSYQLDSTHKVGDRQTSFASPGSSAVVDNDVPVLRRAIWLESDRQYRAASESWLRMQSSKEVSVETAENRAPDFSREEPHTSVSQSVPFTLDRRPWEERVRKYTAAFSASPAVLNSIATFTTVANNQYQINSEGSKLAFGQLRYRLELFVQSKAPDGMDIDRFANFDWVSPKDAPSDATVMARIQQMISEVVALDKAPLVEPYAGPVLLSGRAAAVFFHEVLGHRLEGFRQKDINEGQTFAHKVGEKILPDFISVLDDPTRSQMGNEVLLGYYPFDDEGVPAQNVVLVDHGILKSFLMGRSPLKDFPHSNGHGRRQVGFQPVARMGNTIVQSDDTMTNAQLRAKLIDLIKEQNKPYGLFIDDIAGGFTFTGRGQPQAFQVQPLVVYRVFPDGRPDELVRGVDIVGTPLVSMTKIVGAGDTTEVFNGFCGAESGSIPVSASAPAILISEMEVQKKETSTDTPPLLPPPAHDPESKGQTR
ncbi:MAG: TldD/PmbA family protein [Candidatus Acidiferrales bacterium]